MAWQPSAYESLLQGDYAAVADFYEQAIEENPEIISYYWYLGLAYLLEKQEEEAQNAWFYGIFQGTLEEIEQGKAELSAILDTEANRQESIKNYFLATLIRTHLKEVNPGLINNLLNLIKLSLILNQFSPEQLTDWQVIEHLQNSNKETVDGALLLQTLGKILEFPSLEAVALTEASLPHINKIEPFIQTVMSVATLMAYDYQRPTYAADLTKVCLKIAPNNPYLLNELLTLYSLTKNYQELFKTAHYFYEYFEKYCKTISLKVYSNYRLLFAFLDCNYWLEIDEIVQKYKQLLQEMIAAHPKVLEPIMKDHFLAIAAPLFYLFDNLVENRYFTNQIAKIFYNNFSPLSILIKGVKKTKIKINNIEGGSFPPASCPPPLGRGGLPPAFLDKFLKIGYISHTLRKHSVGWLSRWLFHYHNREKFKIYLYLVNQPEDELTENWFRKNADVTYNFSKNSQDMTQKSNPEQIDILKADVSYNYCRDPQAIAKQIKTDQIDILVDLDSLTHNLTYQVMSLKAAPIQVTWLGFDASGLPTIDYFITDPYVLPENAQEYYQETLYPLQSTYIAVDGFEVGEQTLNREKLGIAEDAIIYLSVQNGLKRHPHTINLQMKILQAVPNSYFLIKGAGNNQKIQELFNNIAQNNDVNSNRLIFLQQDIDEPTHRANLNIADVVLDTYPYNGATTTLEVLWMGIPLVTRVGEQFAARNSYAFMKNVGLNEGIAWTDEEYIQWGIKLGTDKKLRQEITQKLIDSHQTSPLWNAKLFTQEMEKAYQEMYLSRSQK